MKVIIFYNAFVDILDNPYYLLYPSWTQVFSGLETFHEVYGTILVSISYALT